LSGARRAAKVSRQCAFYRDPHRDHWGRIGTDATAPYERRDDFVRKRIPGADTVDLAAYFDRWPE